MKTRLFVLIQRIICAMSLFNVSKSQTVVIAEYPSEVDSAMVSDCIFQLDDRRCKNNTIVGGKTATLHNLINTLNINTPKGFNVSTKIYDAYLKAMNIDKLVNDLDDISQQWKASNEKPKQQAALESKIEQLSGEIQSHILHGTVDAKYLTEIESYYKKLEEANQPALVAVRSSATAEDLANLSFAGQYESCLNQRGLDQVVDAIKKVWASTYNIKSINYRNKNNIKHNETKMAALVQLMVNAQSSGRAYSVDIETGAPFITIKNLHGLGEAEASGIASPDTWVINPVGNIIIKRCLGNKGLRVEYDRQQEKTVIISNSPEQQHKYAISCEQAKKLTKEIKRIQEYFLTQKVTNVEIEYAFTSQGELFITQARPETSWGKQTVFKAVDKEKVDTNRIILAGGSMGWGGVVTGPLRILRSLEDAKKRHQKGDIMVVGNTTNVWENFMVISGGLISQENVTSSHAVATTREQGIPSLVGHPQAMETLQQYDGQIVTLDATSRRVYLGAIPKEFLYFPPEIETTFHGLDIVSEEAHWQASSNVGLTDIDANNNRWLKRPVGGNRTFQHEINKKAYDWIAAKAGLPIVEKRVVAKTLQVSFPVSHKWEELLREKDLPYFEWVYNERIKVNNEYIQASLELEYNAASVKRWINAAIEFYGFQSMSYVFGQVTDGLLHNALAQRNLREPYLSQVQPSTEATIYGETLSKERVRIFNGLLTQIKLQPELITLLRCIANGDTNSELVLKNNHWDFYKELEHYAKNYRVIEAFSIDFAEPWFLKEIARQLTANLDTTKERTSDRQVPAISQEFFPDDPEFQRTCRLAILIQKLKLDTHHLRCRGHWKFREFMVPFGKFLKEKGVITELSEIFDHEPQWLIDQFEKYETEINPNQLKLNRTENFQMDPYEIYHN